MGAIFISRIALGRLNFLSVALTNAALCSGKAEQSKAKELPALAKDIDCTSWGQFYLKPILGHPAATCIIPATSKTHHMIDNMQANFGQVPDQSQRKEMRAIFSSL